MAIEQITEYWDYQPLSLNESKKHGVLGILEGEAFYEDKASRNVRVYPKGAWGKALSRSETKRVLDDLLMFGTVGHLNVDLDTLIREDKVGIRTVSLKMNEDTGTGYGKFEILDTVLGRFLHMVAKGGSKFRVSTKAQGDFKGKDEQGNAIVDPDSLVLERVDIVVHPGYLDANPKLKEELQEAYSTENFNSNNDIGEDVDMSEKLVEKLLTEKVTLETQLGTISKDLEIAQEKLSDLKSLKEQFETAKSDIETLTEKVEAADKFFTEHGSMEQIKEELDKFKDLSEALEVLGPIDKIGKALDSAKVVGERLSKIGTLESIEEALDQAALFIHKVKDERFEEAVTDLSAKHGIGEDKIRPLLAKNSKDEVGDILKDLKVMGGRKTDEKEDDSKDDRQSFSDKSRSVRLMEGYTGANKSM